MIRSMLFFAIAMLWTLTAAAQDAGLASPFQRLTESGLDDARPNHGQLGLGTVGPLGSDPAAGSGQGYGSADSSPRFLRGRGNRGPTIVIHSLPETIRSVVLQNLASVRRCYSRALTHEPRLGGRVITRFTIRHDGTVSEASVVEADVLNSRFNACLTRTLLRWRFPPNGEGGTVVVSYPFNFQTTDEPQRAPTLRRPERPRITPHRVPAGPTMRHILSPERTA